MIPRLYDPTTAAQLAALRKQLPHAILLEGAPGMGLLSTAQDIAGGALSGVIQPTDKEGSPDPNGSIKIEQIRRLYEQTRGKSRNRQVFVIDDADRMVVQAQHALLKLLEEPAAQINFILTAHHSRTLLPTILSRVQRVTLRPISPAQSQQLLHSLGTIGQTALQQILFLAEGRPARLTNLAMNSEDLAESAHIMHDARILLQGAITEKLRVIHNYSNDRIQTLQLIEAALTIIDYSISQTPAATQIVVANKLARAHERIAANGTAKLHLLVAVL
jgi:replication-associated recombination protein RarA